MRNVMILAAFAVLAACGGKSETYQASVSDTWSKVSSSGYSAGSYGLPAGLLGADVKASFESFPGDRTGYWKFMRKGKELGRINVAVEGDEASSTVSYSYAKGDVAAEDEKAERMVRQYSQTLVAEAIDASIESRARDDNFKRHADAQSMAAMMGDMMKQVDKSMNEAVKDFDRQDREREISNINSQARNAKANSTKPSVNLKGY